MATIHTMYMLAKKKIIAYTSSALNVYSMAIVSHQNLKAYHTNLFWHYFLDYSPYGNLFLFSVLFEVIDVSKI